MKIYTKTGDKGQTALYGGMRVSKASLRVETYGTIDELNAFIGVAKSHIIHQQAVSQLKKVQYDLFTLGAEIATPPEKLFLANGQPRQPITISETEIEELEQWIDAMETELEPLQFFILPGGGIAATSLHTARTICRRAERLMVYLDESESIRNQLIMYVNRLSDYLFVLARFVSKHQNEPEEFWKPRQ